MKNILSLCKIILITAIMIGSNLIAFNANAQVTPVLGVTQITAVQTFASPDNTFENGWRWVFDITVPENETVLNMKFADWIKSADTIPASGNIRFYSEQSSNATTNSPIVLSSKNTYSNDLYINKSVDLDTIKSGR